MSQRSDQFVAVEISRCKHLHREETFLKYTFSEAFENVQVEKAGVDDIHCGALRNEIYKCCFDGVAYWQIPTNEGIKKC